MRHVLQLVDLPPVAPSEALVELGIAAQRRVLGHERLVRHAGPAGAAGESVVVPATELRLLMERVETAYERAWALADCGVADFDEAAGPELREALARLRALLRGTKAAP